MKTKILIFCLLSLGIAFTALHILKVPVGNLLYFGAILLCPLMHIFMMKGMNHRYHEAGEKNEQKKDLIVEDET